MAQYIQDRCPSCSAELPGEAAKFVNCPYCGSSLRLELNETERQHEIALLEAEQAKDDRALQDRRINLEVYKQQQLNRRERLRHLRAMERIEEEAARRQARQNGSYFRPETSRPARGFYYGNTRPARTGGVGGAIVVLIVLGIGIWWFFKGDGNESTSKQPASSNREKAETRSQPKGEANAAPPSVGADNGRTNSSQPEAPSREIPSPDSKHVTDLRVRVRTMTAEISGQRYITLALNGTIVWHGEELRFYLSGQNVTVGDSLTYPIGEELSKRKQFAPAQMKLDLYNMEGLMQSFTRRPELKAVAFATGITIKSISKDGKSVVVEVDGQDCVIPFTEGSDTTTRLPK